jgi:DNA-binding MarR family transcriptional regulator
MADRFRPHAELDFLVALEHGEVISQLTLAQRIAVSVGFINSLLKRAMRKGYVKAKAAPYKRYAYYLTPRGFSEKSRLVAEYLDSSLSFFRKARAQYAEIFAAAEAQRHKRVAFVGDGELVEIALLAARETKLEIVCLIDQALISDRKFGLPVVRTCDGIDVDAVIITESRKPQAAFDTARQSISDGFIFVPKLLNVSRAPQLSAPNVSGPGRRK